jgi:DNA-binding Xre family transcriptional regulator
MLKLNIKKHCLLRNHSDAAAYLRHFGFTQWRAFKLTGDKVTSIPFSDIEKLCIVFRCTPNDLFEWTPNDAKDNTADHPLTPLRPENSVDLRINSLSFAQLKEIAKIVGEKK